MRRDLSTRKDSLDPIKTDHSFWYSLYIYGPHGAYTSVCCSFTRGLFWNSLLSFAKFFITFCFDCIHIFLFVKSLMCCNLIGILIKSDRLFVLVRY